MSAHRWSPAARAIRPLLILALALGSATACATKRVSRIDPESVTDLSGRWNDTDSRLVANALIDQSLSGPWLSRYSSTHGGESPTVIVGSFRNRSMEHIPVETFLNDLERAFVSADGVRLVASKTERQEVREEREDQQDNARADTRARLAQESGARYMLQGEIQTIEDQEGSEKVIYYQVDATMVDLESNEKVWVGQHKMKKYIERRRLGF